MTKEQAEDFCLVEGKECRVVSNDGIMCCATRDYTPDRVNLALLKNVVVAYYFDDPKYEQDKDVV